MARIRTIKPETFTSESIAALSLPARWTFVGLWTYVDDEGRAKDNTKIIRGALWPNDEDTITSRDVEAHLVELEHHAMICRYMDVDGNGYLHVINFKKHQVVNRSTPSRIPQCPFHDGTRPQEPKPQVPHGGHTHTSDTTQSETPEASNATHAQLTEPSVLERKGKEQGSGSGNGTGNAQAQPLTQPPLLVVVEPPPLAPLAARPDARFDEFWKTYPRRVGPEKARPAFAAAVKRGANPQAIIDAARSLADRHKALGTEKKYIPHPTTWLHRGSWADDLDDALPLPTTAAPTPQRPGNDLGGDEHMRRFLARQAERRQAAGA